MSCCALFRQRLNGPDKPWKVHPELVTICDQLSSIVFKLAVVLATSSSLPCAIQKAAPDTILYILWLSGTDRKLRSVARICEFQWVKA
jgi:hypothetical protein